MKNPACLSCPSLFFLCSPQFPPQRTDCLLFSEVPSTVLTSWGPLFSGGSQSEPHTFLAAGLWLLKQCVCIGVCGIRGCSREPHTRLSHPVNLQIRERALLWMLSSWPWRYFPHKLAIRTGALVFLFQPTAYVLAYASSHEW